MKVPCQTCKIAFPAYYLKDGRCNGCRNPHLVIKAKINFFRVQTETIEGPFKVSIDSFYSKPDHWFETPHEATADFLRVRAIAKTRAENILKEFEDLQSRLGFHVGFTYEGDTHGIYEAYQYIRFTEERYHFTLKIEND